jgi:hypothetical protein
MPNHQPDSDFGPLPYRTKVVEERVYQESGTRRKRRAGSRDKNRSATRTRQTETSVKARGFLYEKDQQKKKDTLDRPPLVINLRGGTPYHTPAPRHSLPQETTPRVDMPSRPRQAATEYYESPPKEPRRLFPSKRQERLSAWEKMRAPQPPQPPIQHQEPPPAATFSRQPAYDEYGQPRLSY